MEAHVGRPAMIRRLGRDPLMAAGMAAFALVVVMAFMRRDHKVELVATYHRLVACA